MTKKVQYIINLLKANQDELYVDGAFRWFIDNQIDVNELTEILNAEGYSLPKEFYRLSKAEQKKYRQHSITYVPYDKSVSDAVAYVTFNNPYFYDLAEHARKTIVYTDKLTKYVYNLVDCNLIFLGMQYIKTQYSFVRKFPKLLAFAEKNNLDNLYDLTMELIGGLHIIKEETELKSLLVKQLDRRDTVGLDLLDTKIEFFFLMEYLLNHLPRKEANTLKVKFLILPKNTLRGDLDYYDLDKPAKWILKDYLGKGLFDKRAVKKVKEFIKKNPSLLDGIEPNGYMAFYYAFLAEEGDING